MRYSVLLLASVFCASLVVGQDKPVKYPVELKDFELTIVSGGVPVSGVSVQLYACRCEEDSGSHYGWPNYNTDAPTKLTSDEDGKVQIKWPVKFGSPISWKTTSQISMMLQHPEFVHDELHIDPREEKAEKELRAGCELTFSAVDPQRVQVDFGVVMAGPGRSVKWLREDGIVRSRAIPDGTWQTMLVSPQDDGRHLFSGVLPVRLANGQDVKMRNLRLRPGMRVAGRLSDNVPRPIKQGRVQVRSIPKPAGAAYANENPSVTWSDNVKIQEDGTFEFMSLPRTGQLQFIAICEGWLGVNEGTKEKFGRVQGLLVDVDDLDIVDNQVEDLTISMEETGTVVVTVLKPNGDPLPAANVYTNPNQVSVLGGSTIVGARGRSIDSIRAQLGEKVEPYQRDIAPPQYSGKTDENGQATLSGIPLKRNEDVTAHHDDFMVPLNPNGRQKTKPYICHSSKPVNVTIKMQARQD